MTNIIDSTGIHTDDLQTIITRRTTEKQSIYGADINVDSNTPDGQQININSQAERDILDVAEDTYNSFDPDKAVGVSLDARCALNGVLRNGGTFSTTPINITVDRALTLSGLDADYSKPAGVGFTVSDNLGNNWILISTYAFSGAGTVALSFRSGAIGAIASTPNTITNQTTIVVGVTAVNNPAAQSGLGQDTETDAELRIRRMQSISLPALGYLDSIRASLLQIEDVTDAKVFENFGSTTDIYGIPPHSIWAIINGGTDAEIANVIYKKKSYGCGMFGTEAYTITKAQGDTIIINFDRPVAEILYIKFSLLTKVAGSTYDPDYVKTTLASQLIYSIGEQSFTSRIIELLTEIAPGFVPYDVFISKDEVSWAQLLDVTLLKNYFSVSATNITIV